MKEIGVKGSEKTVIKMGTDENAVDVILHQDSETGKYYLTYEMTQGATGSFDLTFNTPNGTTANETSFKVTPRIIDKAENDHEGAAVTGKWNATFDWKDVWKGVDKQSVEPKDEESNTTVLGSDLVYTISNEHANGEDKGEIWTKYVTFTDTLTLPAELSFVGNNYHYDDTSHSIIDENGKVLCTLEGNEYYGIGTTDGKPQIIISDVSVSGKELKYKATIENPNKEGDSYLREMDHPKITMTLKGDQIKVTEEFGAENTAKIKNKVDFKAVSVTGDEKTSSKEVETVVKNNDHPEVVKSATGKEGQELDSDKNKETKVKAGDEINYTVTVTNKGKTTLKDAVTDTLPKGLLL